MQSNEMNHIIDKFSLEFNGEQLQKIKKILENIFFEKNKILFSCKNLQELSQSFFECYLVNVKKTTAKKKHSQSAVFQFFCYIARVGFNYKYTLLEIGNFLEYDSHHNIINAIDCYNKLRSINDPLTMEVYNKWLFFNKSKQISA